MVVNLLFLSQTTIHHSYRKAFSNYNFMESITVTACVPYSILNAVYIYYVLNVLYVWLKADIDTKWEMISPFHNNNTPQTTAYFSSYCIFFIHSFHIYLFLLLSFQWLNLILTWDSPLWIFFWLRKCVCRRYNWSSKAQKIHYFIHL